MHKKTQPIVKEFSDEFIKNMMIFYWRQKSSSLNVVQYNTSSRPIITIIVKNINNQLYCNLCYSAIFRNKRFLVNSHRNMSKHEKALGSRSANISPRLRKRF